MIWGKFGRRIERLPQAHIFLRGLEEMLRSSPAELRKLAFKKAVAGRMLTESNRVDEVWKTNRKTSASSHFYFFCEVWRRGSGAALQRCGSSPSRIKAGEGRMLTENNHLDEVWKTNRKTSATSHLSFFGEVCRSRKPGRRRRRAHPCNACRPWRWNAPPACHH